MRKIWHLYIRFSAKVCSIGVYIKKNKNKDEKHVKRLLQGYNQVDTVRFTRRNDFEIGQVYFPLSFDKDTEFFSMTRFASNYLLGQKN